jgi:hypothetical protein
MNCQAKVSKALTGFFAASDNLPTPRARAARRPHSDPATEFILEFYLARSKLSLLEKVMAILHAFAQARDAANRCLRRVLAFDDYNLVLAAALAVASDR